MSHGTAASQAARRIDHDAVVGLAAELVETPGHQELPAHERAVAELLATRLTGRLPPAGRSAVSVQEVEDGRLNVTALIQGDRPGPTLMLNAHLDTVPGYDMPDAFVAVQRDGRLHGRGAVDMKAALAAMITCVETLAAPDVSFAGQLVLTAVAGEESGSAGMLALSRASAGADFAIVGEPTSMRIARSHKGAMWIEASFRGVATHGSVPNEGINAAYHAARFITAVVERAPADRADASAARQRNGERRCGQGRRPAADGSRGLFGPAGPAVAPG